VFYPRVLVKTLQEADLFSDRVVSMKQKEAEELQSFFVTNDKRSSRKDSKGKGDNKN